MRILGKTNIKKTIIVFITSLILINFSVFINEATIFNTMDVIFGLSELSHIKEKTIFLIFVLLIQYYNADILSFNLYNSDYLSIRYCSRKKYWYSIIKDIYLNCLVLFVTVLVSLNIISLIHNQECAFIKIGTIVVAFVMCVTVTFIQLCLLLNYRENTVVWLMIFGCILYSLAKQMFSDFFYENILGKISINHFMVYIAFVVIYLLSYMFFNKECRRYVNKSN